MNAIEHLGDILTSRRIAELTNRVAALHRAIEGYGETEGECVDESQLTFSLATDILEFS